MEPAVAVVDTAAASEQPLEQQQLGGAGADDDPHQTTSNIEHEERCCRICLEAEGAAAAGAAATSNNNKDDDSLIAPCSCKGSQKWVHRSCLDQWRALNSQDLAFSQCTECQTKYQLKLTEHPRKKQAIFCLFLSRDLILAMIAVQLVIAFFGLVFYAIALAVFDSAGDEFATQEQLLGGCETARCVLGLCYGGGVLLLLFALGILGSCVFCNNGCSTSRSLEAVGYVPRRRGHRGIGSSSSSRCCDHWCHGCHCYGCNADGDAAACLLAVLVIVAVVLVVVGFLVGCLIAVLGLQALVQRHVWRLQKRRLVSEYKVVDLAHAAREEIDFETGTKIHPPPSAPPLPEEDSIRLQKLGLLE